MNTPVGFHAQLSTYTLPEDTPIKYTDVKFNKGGCYSTITGKFTANIHGLYYFEQYWVMWYDQVQYLSIKKNGIEQCRSLGIYYSTDTYAYNAPSCSAVMDLAVGDEVWVTSSHGKRVHIPELTGFTGFLIKAYV